MTYNGRAIMDQIATEAGWTVQPLSFQPDPTVEWVVYTYGYVADVLIAWTPQNSATYVGIDGKQVRGATALIDARQHIDKHRVA